jgi:hypothetical protein
VELRAISTERKQPHFFFGVVEIACGLGTIGIPADGAAHAARGVKSLATRAAWAVHSGPRAAVRTMASPAVCIYSLPRKAGSRYGRDDDGACLMR